MQIAGSERGKCSHFFQKNLPRSHLMFNYKRSERLKSQRKLQGTKTFWIDVVHSEPLQSAIGNIVQKKYIESRNLEITCKKCKIS